VPVLDLIHVNVLVLDFIHVKYFKHRRPAIPLWCGAGRHPQCGNPQLRLSMAVASNPPPQDTPLRLSIHRGQTLRPPPHARCFYKVVAVRADGMFVSIFDGRTEYPLEQTTCVRSGIYASASIEAVVMHGRLRLPRRSALLDAPRAILRLYGWLEDGSDPVPSVTGKYRLDSVLPVAVLPWSSSQAHAQVPPQWVPFSPQRRPSTAPPAGPAPRSASASMTGAATYRERGAHHFSEHMQAFTAQLHEDILAMQETLQGLRVRRCSAPRLQPPRVHFCVVSCGPCFLLLHVCTAHAPCLASWHPLALLIVPLSVLIETLRMSNSRSQNKNSATTLTMCLCLPNEQTVREQGRALATSVAAQGRARGGWLSRAMSRTA
jgi:hypothetical protein